MESLATSLDKFADQWLKRTFNEHLQSLINVLPKNIYSDEDIFKSLNSLRKNKDVVVLGASFKFHVSFIIL